MIKYIYKLFRRQIWFVVRLAGLDGVWKADRQLPVGEHF
ncbi:MAG: hypothetical protein ANABAC_0836 [Anaerolineae bacterium]|nr:MAG: hypothetical protein ANABAC_0836 [Anaerolineae bacterium]